MIPTTSRNKCDHGKSSGSLDNRKFPTMAASTRDKCEPSAKASTTFLICLLPKSHLKRIPHLQQMAECIINCRPLTKANGEDGLPPLRPIDLTVGALQPRIDCAFPFLSFPRYELRRGHRYTQKITEMWWERWLKLYVTKLQARQKW